MTEWESDTKTLCKKDSRPFYNIMHERDIKKKNP